MADNSLIEMVRENLAKIDPMIEKAQDTINFMRDAGEDTEKMERELKTLRMRRDKWQRALEMRGQGI